jgi:hypothetical protein
MGVEHRREGERRLRLVGPPNPQEASRSLMGNWRDWVKWVRQSRQDREPIELAPQAAPAEKGEEGRVGVPEALALAPVRLARVRVGADRALWTADREVTAEVEHLLRLLRLPDTLSASAHKGSLPKPG